MAKKSIVLAVLVAAVALTALAVLKRETEEEK